MPSDPHAAVFEREGLDVLLDKCLSVVPGDELLVLYDESFAPYIDPLCAAPAVRDVAVTWIFMPTASQIRLADRATASRNAHAVPLPRPLKDALLSATVILNVLNGEQHTSIVRGSIIEAPRSQDSRFAHVPGLDRDVLKVLQVSPIADICEWADLVAWALGEAREAELVTTDSSGRGHSLRLNLGGWDNEPLISSGVIHPGSWGNVPPGEAFCCPEPLTVNGSICIDGSLPGRCMSPGEEVILSFEHGVLTRWQGTPAHLEFFDREQERAIRSGDKYWNYFAELGIGLNPAITELTGNSLYDEKAYGTVHIAIGANDSFGHPIEADIHADLVTRRVALTVDGFPVLSDGILHLEDIERRRLSQQVRIPTFGHGARILLRDGRFHFDPQSVKRLLSKAHRLGRVSVAPPAQDAALASVAHYLRDRGEVSVSAFLAQHETFDGVATEYLLALLDHYKMLGFRNG